MALQACNPSTGKTETGRAPGTLASWLDLLGELHASEILTQNTRMKKKSKLPKQQKALDVLWLTYTYIHRHTHTSDMHPHTHRHAHIYIYSIQTCTLTHTHTATITHTCIHTLLAHQGPTHS